MSVEPMLGDKVLYEKVARWNNVWTIDCLWRLSDGRVQAKLIKPDYVEVFDPCVTRYDTRGHDTRYVFMETLQRRTGRYWRPKR